jgi:hypothetical protein
LIVLAATAAFAVGAQAQTPTSTQDVIPNTAAPSLSETALADRAFRDLVGCVIRYQPERTRNLLNTIPGTRAEGRILYSFESRMEACYDSFRTGRGALFYQGNLLRGVIAEVYYGREFPAGIPAIADEAPELAAQWARPRPADGAVTQMEMLHAMARCVTARQPDAVGTLLRTGPLSAEERAALRSLQPEFSTCLDSGVQFESSRQSLRALLAEAAFHFGEARRRGFAPAAETAAAAD